jgi:hypothetical protein
MPCIDFWTYGILKFSNGLNELNHCAKLTTVEGLDFVWNLLMYCYIRIWLQSKCQTSYIFILNFGHRTVHFDCLSIQYSIIVTSCQHDTNQVTLNNCTGTECWFIIRKECHHSPSHFRKELQVTCQL